MAPVCYSHTQNPRNKQKTAIISPVFLKKMCHCNQGSFLGGSLIKVCLNAHIESRFYPSWVSASALLTTSLIGVGLSKSWNGVIVGPSVPLFQLIFSVEIRF